MKDAELRDDPPAAAEPPLPLHPEQAALDTVHSRNDPESAIALAALREAAGEALLVGEVYLPSAMLPRYLEHLDLAFAFEFLHAPWSAPELRRGRSPRRLRWSGVAWVLSNHDFPRLATRLGEAAAPAAAMLLLTLPGTAFVYQGEEIGMVNGSYEGHDRFGRDGQRHPMQWEPEPGGGFSEGEPWMGLTDPERRSVAAQRDDPGSLLGALPAPDRAAARAARAAGAAGGAARACSPSAAASTPSRSTSTPSAGRLAARGASARCATHPGADGAEAAAPIPPSRRGRRSPQRV